MQLEQQGLHTNNHSSQPNFVLGTFRENEMAVNRLNGMLSRLLYYSHATRSPLEYPNNRVAILCECAAVLYRISMDTAHRRRYPWIPININRATDTGILYFKSLLHNGLPFFYGNRFHECIIGYIAMWFLDIDQLSRQSISSWDRVNGIYCSVGKYLNTKVFKYLFKYFFEYLVFIFKYFFKNSI